MHNHHIAITQTSLLMQSGAGWGLNKCGWSWSWSYTRRPRGTQESSPVAILPPRCDSPIVKHMTVERCWKGSVLKQNKIKTMCT